MQTVSTVYLEKMGEMIREPSKMRLTFHYPTGDIVYTNTDIVNVTEKKTAHLIAGALPSIDVSIELINTDGSFNPNDISGLHDMIVEGVRINYEFGFDVPELEKYGYFESDEWHDYGMEQGVPYGFVMNYATEWVAGGEVFTSGEISYSQTTANITAKDFLSFLDDEVVVSYGTRTLAQIAMDVINLTDYPEDTLGAKKLVTGSELDTFSTTIMLGEISAKNHLQTIAHAGGVQMYIDRLGYIHLDNDQQLTSPAQYTLSLNQQAENPSHHKEQMPKKLAINLNADYGLPVEVELKGGGEAMVVDNDFIVTTAEGEALRDRILNSFIKYRNTADIPYRGEPALDVLDNITIDTEFADDVPAVIVGTELQFNGTLNGSLTLRYDLGQNIPDMVKITGGDSFIYPLGSTVPSTTLITLTCVTDIPTPTYQWSYYTVSSGDWLDIVGETTNQLAVAYNDIYFTNDSSVKFRCVVNTQRGAMAQISKVQLQKSSTSGYRGTVVATTPASIDIPSAEVGDVVLMDNTTDATAEVYGEAYVYDGEEWVNTEESDALAMTYKDALQLAKDSGKTIYVADLYADLIVTKNLIAGEGDGTAESGFRFRAMSDSERDGSNVPVFDVTYNSDELFKVDPSTGKIYFGTNFWYDPADGAIHTPNDKTVINADGTIEAVDGIFSGDIWAKSGYFKGIFDTTALKLEPSVANPQSETFGNVNNQAYLIWNWMKNTLGITENSLRRCTLDYDINAKYIKSYTVYEYRINYYAIIYDETYTVLYTLRYNTYGGVTYINDTIDLTLYTGGDKLILSSDIPTETTELSDYQIYRDGDILKVKLP